MIDERFPIPSSANPLMQPVQYNDQTYYTSQYFHVQYLAGHQETAKKYKRHPHFARLLRSIEAYALYVEGGDIVELVYQKESEESRNQILVSLWKSVAYNPITLLNATAQLALVQHLDDELSKQMAYTVNTKVAHEATVMPLRAGSMQTQMLEAMVHLSRQQDAQAEAIAALQQHHETLEAKVDAVVSRQPPQGKMRVEDWLRRHHKPFLPREVLAHFRAACKRIEVPEAWRPDGAEYLTPYFSPYTLAAAYEDVTRQLSFFSESQAAYRRRR